ncbi:MAG: tail fiber protein [Sulfurospirillaceae bacterium]|nr:tail fiber protein [Sulfurospirillaceae bacterium]
MKRHALATFMALTMSVGSFAGGPDDYIGSVWATAGTYCPRGTIEANGQILQIQAYGALYAVMGCAFGGDCRTTFAVPDMRGRTPVGAGTTAGLTPVPMGQKRGYESVQLNAKQLPAHTHPFSPKTGSQDVTIPATTGTNMNLSGTVGVATFVGNTQVPSASTPYRLAGFSTAPGSPHGPYTSESLPNPAASITGVSVDASTMTPNIPAKTVSIQTVTGGEVGANSTSNLPISTIPPQIGLLYCITTVGTFPERP